MNALRLPAFFENLGHSNVILTAGGGSFGHKDGPKQGAMSCRQGEETSKLLLPVTRMTQNKVPCPADREKKLGSCGKQAPTEMCHFQMGLWNMRRRTKKSRVHSSHSRKMLIKSTQDGKRNWVTLVNPQSRQQHLIGRRRQQHDILHFNLQNRKKKQ